MINIKTVNCMNFNKLLAACCGICAITIFVFYFVNYYEVLESFTENLQRLVIGISVIGGIGFLTVLLIKFKQVFSKAYIITTIILLLIAIMSMWFNYFLYVRI